MPPSSEGSDLADRELYSIPASSSWFRWDEIHDTEKRSLPEFFDGSAASRNPRVYKEYRDFIINKYREDPSRRITFTEIRKSLIGDVGYIQNVFRCLEKWGLVNFWAKPVAGVPPPAEDAGPKVVVEEGVPGGVQVVQASIPQRKRVATTGLGGENGFKLPSLTSYTDVFGDWAPKRGPVCGVCGKQFTVSGSESLWSSPSPTFQLPPMGIRLRRRRWLLISLASALSAYGAYRIYHLPSVARGRRKLSRVLAALSAAADAAASTAEAVSLVSSDLTLFLRSDSADLPSSLKQITKIVRSDEFSASVSRVSEALTTGIARGIQFGEHSTYPSISEPRDGARFTDRIMDRLFSASGSGLVSVMAGSFARGLMLGFYQSESSDGEERLDSQAVPRWVQLMCRDESRELIGNCVELFVSTAVTVYLEKTMEINAFDEFFSGLTNPIHEAKMKDMLVSVCNGAVQTLVKTSHQVLTSSNSSSHGNKAESSKFEEKSGAELASSSTLIEDGGGWVDQITSTLAVPGNRRFVLDVTGRITFETVRSFLDFVLWKVSDASRRGANGVKEELIRGLEVLKHLSARSIIIIALCLCLCLHIYMRMPILTSDLVGN